MENKKERKYADKMTIGMLEKANLPISQMQQLFNKEREFTTGDLAIFRALANACMIEGEPFTEDAPLEDMQDLLGFQEHFLVKSRFQSARDKLKLKRSPKP